VPGALIAEHSGACRTPLQAISLKVSATGIEEGSDWAIVRLGVSHSSDEILEEGERLQGCLKLVSVRKSSIVLLNIQTDERREFFLAGYSAMPSAAAPKQPATNQDFVNIAMERHKVVRVSDLVDRIDYPLSANSSALPKLIFHNRSGSSFYGDYAALGLGERSPGGESSDESAHVQGVRINQPSENSFLGSLGFKDGQKIVAINGQFVKSPEDISRLLEQRRDAPVSIGYYDPESQMILGEHAVISSH